jgi:hypothetical protein
MSFGLRTTSCCGLLELADISEKSSPDQVVDGLLAELYRNTSAWLKQKPFILFTGVVERAMSDHVGADTGYGEALASYIEANDLGTVFAQIPTGVNWTHNTIQIWIWYPNYVTLRELNNKRRASQLQREEARARRYTAAATASLQHEQGFMSLGNQSIRTRTIPNDRVENVMAEWRHRLEQHNLKYRPNRATTIDTMTDEP